MGTYTDNLNLYKSANAETGWGTLVSNNFNILDAAVYANTVAVALIDTKVPYTGANATLALGVYPIQTPQIYSTTGVITLQGAGGTNNESLAFDFETADRPIISSPSGAERINLSGLGLRFDKDKQLVFGNADDAVFQMETNLNDSFQLGL